jgi:hypothetical protein
MMTPAIRKISCGKFWQPDSVSENLRGLGLQRPRNSFLSAMGECDDTMLVATEDHSSNEQLMSSTYGYWDLYIYSAILK